VAESIRHYSTQNIRETIQDRHMVRHTHTLASDDLDTHAGMLVPRQRVKLDKSRHHRFVQVDVTRRICVSVTLEDLTSNKVVQTGHVYTTD